MNIAIGIMGFALVYNFLIDIAQFVKHDRLSERVSVIAEWTARLDADVSNLRKTVAGQISDLHDFKNELLGIIENMHQTDLANTRGIQALTKGYLDQQQKMEWLIGELRSAFSIVWERLATFSGAAESPTSE